MERIPIAIVGCGGMGGRHLRGMKELYDSGMANVELVAACDLKRENAKHLADTAEALLGDRPRVYTDIEAMARALPDLQAVDVTTDSGSHHMVVSAALDLGLHVLCEKPLASTIRGCNLIMAQHQGSDRVLSVAEQFRRDPICRLMRALIEAGAIGEPRMYIDVGASGGDRILIFPWRHDKRVGGIFVDAGVHTTDLMQYYLGPVREVYAQARVMEPVRHKSPQRTATSEFYDHWYAAMPDQVDATAEDTVVAQLSFESGVMGQWTSFQAAHGEAFHHTVVYGGRGSLRTAGWTTRARSPPTASSTWCPISTWMQSPPPSLARIGWRRTPFPLPRPTASSWRSSTTSWASASRRGAGPRWTPFPAARTWPSATPRSSRRCSIAP